MEPPITVVAVTIRRGDGCVLAVRKRGTTAFMQPGGKPDPGETPEQTAVRETAEELGVELTDLHRTHTWLGPAANEPGRLVQATVIAATMVGEPHPAAEIEELRWLDPYGDVAAQLGEYRLAGLLAEVVLPAVRRISVIGVGADGWAGLSDTIRARISVAPRLVGATRLLAMLPDMEGQSRESWPSPFSIDVVRPGDVVLASGDPLLSGVAGTLITRFGADAVDVVPHVSALTLARARMRWPAGSCAEMTVVGRRVEAVVREAVPGRRILALTSDADDPARIAALLRDRGQGASLLTVLGDLGSVSESRYEFTADAVPDGLPTLHVLAVEVAGRHDGSGWVAGLPDEAFENDGQLTKRDLRASALAQLQPTPGELLWDVGAGAGSVGIEWMRADPTCRTIAVERDADRVARIARNAASLGVPGVEVVQGSAPQALAELPSPDAIFIGGGATAEGLVEECVQRLRAGGRLVVHGVTVETETALAAAYARYGGELTRHSVETAAPLGGFTGWTPARAVTQWAWRKHG